VPTAWPFFYERPITSKSIMNDQMYGFEWPCGAIEWDEGESQQRNRKVQFGVWTCPNGHDDCQDCDQLVVIYSCSSWHKEDCEDPDHHWGIGFHVVNAYELEELLIKELDEDRPTTEPWPYDRYR